MSSAPIIDGIVVGYPAGKTTIAPGETATLTVAAHDVDSQTIQVTVTVTDAAGNVGTGQVPVVVSDPLTYAATATGGATITGGGASNVIAVKA